MRCWRATVHGWLWGLALGMCGLSTAFAQKIGLAAEDTAELGPVVVTATKTEAPLKTVGVSVTVITRQEIEARRVTHIPELLRDVPGLSVVQTGSRGGLVDVFPRGGDSNFNLVLIDGIKVNDAGGAFDFSDLSLDNVERIEIVRGPHSALYGADAMGSVIQIFTRRGHGPPRIQASFGGGNLNTFEEGVNLSGGVGRLGYSLAAGRTDTDGSLRINNAFRETSISGRLDYVIPQNLDLSFVLRYTDGLFQFPTGGAGDRFDPLDPNQSSDRQRLVVSGRATHIITPWWEHTVQLGFFRLDSAFDDRFDPGVDLSDFRSRDEERRLSLDYFWNVTAPPMGQLSGLMTAGFAYEHSEFDQNSVITTPFESSSSIAKARDNRAFYLQGQVDWKKHFFVTAGFRVDDNTSFGTAVTPRVSGVYLIPFTQTKVRASYGEGIKAPSFTENFGTGSPFVVGNPNLRPERSRSWEAGVEQPLPKGLGDLSVTYFDSRFEDLIAFVGGSPSFRNVQAAKASGIELTARIRPGLGFTISASYTFLETKVLDNGGVGGTELPQGAPLVRRPKHAGSLAIGHSWDRLRANITAIFVGDRQDLDFRAFPAARVTLPAYTKVDATLSYLLLKDRSHLRELSLFGRVQNLFDAQYEEVFGFSAPGITFLLGVKGSL